MQCAALQSRSHCVAIVGDNSATYYQMSCHYCVEVLALGVVALSSKAFNFFIAFITFMETFIDFMVFIALLSTMLASDEAIDLRAATKLRLNHSCIHRSITTRVRGTRTHISE